MFTYLVVCTVVSWIPIIYFLSIGFYAERNATDFVERIVYPSGIGFGLLLCSLLAGFILPFAVLIGIAYYISRMDKDGLRNIGPKGEDDKGHC